MDAKHVFFEGVYRLYPSRVQCATEGLSSLVAFLSVTDGRLRRLEFVRLEDTSDLSEITTKEQSLSTINDHPDPSYKWIVDPNNLGKKPDPMPEVLASGLFFAKTQLYLAAAEVVGGRKKPSDFAFWGQALPMEYRQYAAHAVGNMAQSLETMPDYKLALLDMQYSVRRYGLTRESVEEGLAAHVKEGSIGKDIARQMKKAFKRLTFKLPAAQRYNGESFAIPQELATLFPQGVACPIPQTPPPGRESMGRLWLPLRKAMAAFL